MAEFKLNYKNKYSIDVKGEKDPETAEDFEPLAAGIATVEPSFEEETDDTAYYDGGGMGSLDVTGLNTSLSFSGHRVNGDKAQDYIVGLAFKTGEERKTSLKWERADGKTIKGTVTISEITPTGGDANAKETFECTITFDGQPIVEEAGGGGGS